MARIRTIKPEFWTSEQIVECSVNARLLFIGLWNFCDDDGRIVDVPRQIKMKVFPGDDFTADDVHGWLMELDANRLIFRYRIDEQPFIQVTGWHHQKINRPNKSSIPPPPKVIHGALSEPHPPEGKGREGKEGSVVSRDTTGADAPSDPVVDLLDRPSFLGQSEKPTGPPPDKAVYDLGKRVLGKNAGGFITKLKNHFDGDLGKTYGALVQAQEKSDPSEYVGGILRGESAEDEKYRDWETDYYKTVG